MYKRIIQNKRANYQYTILKKLEAGIILLGWEVKSIRFKNIEINNGYIFVKSNEAHLHGVNITPAPTSSTHLKYNATRTRKLLLTKKELYFLHKTTKKNTQKTIIPLELYWKNKWIKITIGIAKGKKKYDKRMKIKKREWMLDKSRILK